MAITYLAITPNQYQAIARIDTVKVSSNDGTNAASISLIHRMSVPSAFDEAMIQACGMQDPTNLEANLANHVKFSIPKGVTNVVELKVTHGTPELARVCTMGIFDALVTRQNQITGTNAVKLRSKNKARLIKVEERLSQNKSLLAKVEKGESVAIPTIFHLLTEIRTLEDEREGLIDSIGNNETPSLVLQSPIFVSNEPSYPNRKKSIVYGLLGGFFLGFMIALARNMIAKLKTEAGGA